MKCDSQSIEAITASPAGFLRSAALRMPPITGAMRHPLGLGTLSRTRYSAADDSASDEHLALSPLLAVAGPARPAQPLPSQRPRHRLVAPEPAGDDSGVVRGVRPDPRAGGLAEP